MEPSATSSSYTRVNLAALEDLAAKHGFGEQQEARFATGDLDAERTGVSFHRVKAGRRQPFAHRHDQAEEVYVVIAGSGRVKIDDEIVDLAPLDAIRVAPGAVRAFEGGPDGLEMLAVGALHRGDGETLPGWW